MISGIEGGFAAAPGGHSLPAAAPGTFWRSSLAALILLAAAAAFAPGVKYGALFLAAITALLAVCKPRTGLWASSAFLIFLFVFCQESQLFGFELPAEYLYWGAGVALITLGLLVAWWRARLALAAAVRLSPLDRALLLLLLVSLAASVYGAGRGNSGFAVARQLFGCLLLPAYYLLARRFLRRPQEAGAWLRAVSWAVLAGAACYVAKLGFLTLTQGSYYREQSALGFYAGAIGAALLAEFPDPAPGWERLRRRSGLAVCVLAIVLLGARFVAGSLAATAAIFAFLRWKRRGLLLPAALLLLAGTLALPGIVRLPERSGIAGEIAARFIFPLDQDLSYIGRMAQWQAVLEVVRQRPLLGNGMGGEISFAAEEVAWIFGTGTYVDNGWGFLLLKMGSLGVGAFLLLVAAVLRLAWRSLAGPATEACRRRPQRPLLAIVIFGLLSFTGGPTFFHFTQAAFLGTALGALAGLDSVPPGQQLEMRRN
jgi:O-antigen ligase